MPSTRVKASVKLRNYSNSRWVHVAKSIVSLKMLNYPKPRYGPSMFTALKGFHFYFYLLLLPLVLCRVATLKSLPVHHP